MSQNVRDFARYSGIQLPIMARLILQEEQEQQEEKAFA